MITPDKDLEILRKEQSNLSDYTRKIAILSLTILIILIVSFARACEKVNGEEVKMRLCQIDKIIEDAETAKTHADRDVSYVFDLFPNDNKNCKLDCPRPSPSPSAYPSPSLGTGQQSAQPPSSPTPAAVGSPSNDQSFEINRELECKKAIENTLEESAQKWFAVKAPVPGVDITIDLRYWIFSLPILYFLSGIYLHILRKKIYVVTMLGSHRIQAGRDVTQMDRLLFCGSSPARPAFSRFPASLETALFMFSYLFLPVYLFYVGAPFWSSWTTSSIIWNVVVLLTLTFYAIAYAHFAAQRLDQQLVALTKQNSQRNLINSLLERSKRIINWLRNTVPPKLTLSTGSLLIILTLFLAMTQESCGETKYKGWDIVRGVPRATWFTANWVFGGVDTSYNSIARLVYIIAVCLAVTTIVVAVVRPLQRAWIVLFLSKITFIVFLFGLNDFWLGILNWIKLVVWVVPIFLWLRYSVFADNRERWVGIRSALVVLYTPVLPIAYFVAVQRSDLPGLFVFLTGLCILTLGYMQAPRPNSSLEPKVL